MVRVDRDVPAGQPGKPEPMPGTVEELLQIHDRLRRAMVYFFRRHRLNDPEELANEVFLRVLRKINKTGVLQRPLDYYCWRVARFVLLEQARVRKYEELSDEMSRPEKNAGGLTGAETAVLLRECMDLLSGPDLDFVRRYLHENKQDLAYELQSTPAAMATRFCRLKKRLQESLRISDRRKPQNSKNIRK